MRSIPARPGRSASDAGLCWLALAAALALFSAASVHAQAELEANSAAPGNAPASLAAMSGELAWAYPLGRLQLQLQAAEERPPSVPDSAPLRTWYGWQNLLVDGLSIGAIALFAAVYPPGVLLGGAGALFASPIVHFAHGNAASGGISLGIRIASWLTLMIGAAIVLAQSFRLDNDERSHPADRVGVAVIVLAPLGLATAIVLDAALFGFQNHGWTHYAVTPPRLLPWFDPAARSAGLRVALAL
jgi:hypothetical protein